MEITVPYVRSSPKAKVIKAEDTVIELLDRYITLQFLYKEEVPKDEEDIFQGTKERKGDCSVTILKSAIVCTETGWDDTAQRYDFHIFTSEYSWGFNCESKSEAREYYDKLTNWLLQ